MPVRNYFKAVMLIGSLGRVKLLTLTKLRIGAQSIVPHSHNPKRRLIRDHVATMQPEPRRNVGRGIVVSPPHGRRRSALWTGTVWKEIGSR
jgi:hypothetical protein